MHYQYGQESVNNKILQDLAHSFVKEPAFDYLRTKEQLGYIVMCLQDDHRGILGLSVLVQSNVKNTYELQKYVAKFINEVLKENINALDEKTFEEYKSALLNTKIQKDKSLAAESSRFWGEIVKHSYEFARKEKEIELIPTVTLAQFKEYHSIYLASSTGCSTTVPKCLRSTKSHSHQPRQLQSFGPSAKRLSKDSKCTPACKPSRRRWRCSQISTATRDPCRQHCYTITRDVIKQEMSR